MKKTVLLLSFCFPLFLTAQRFEAGIYGGGSVYQGDLISSQPEEITKHMHGAGGIFLGYSLGEYLTARLSAGQGFVTGSDAYAKEEGRRARNLSFKSPITEASLRLEFNILGYAPQDDRVFSPYFSIGAGVVGFKPQAYYQNKWIALQPLGTEGQGLNGYPPKYKLTSLAIPFGGGVKIALGENWNLGLDITSNRLFSDYLDDVSGNYVNYTELLLSGAGDLTAALADRTGEYNGGAPTDRPTGSARGNQSAFDWYLTFTATVSYNMLDLFNNLKIGGKRIKTSCPRF